MSSFCGFSFHGNHRVHHIDHSGAAHKQVNCAELSREKPMDVSLRAYARHRGVSLGAVQKAIKAGRIQKTSSGQIDVEAADAQWERNTAPRPSGERHQQKPTASPTLQLDRPSQTDSAEKNTDLGRNGLP